ncbi:MAG: hypothetical protein KAH56_02265 [Candidatus Krumholzibacteria bacterium]|nr:hypothetical protein [Candidatus Krumholzibacteria bacterium]
MWRYSPLFLVLWTLLTPGGASAQLMHLDAVPWFTPADSTSRLALVVEVNRFHDPKFDWNLNRILLTVVLPAGDNAAFFLRLPHMTFDTGNIPVAHRWPWVIGEDGQDGWPHEKRISSFGQIEVGVTGPVGLPLVGWVDYALAMGLPTGTDRVYPFSSMSIPLRLELRKNIQLGRISYLGLVAGYLANMDSGRAHLDPVAFPNGYHLGAALDLYQGRGQRLGLTYDYQDRDSRRSQLVGAQWWMSWGADGSLGFKVARELQGTLDRPAAWYFTLAWRLDSDRYRPQAEVPNP